MRDDICTIPVSEVFEVNDGCPICRMKKTVEDHIVDYIMGAAMMEPDVRIQTNKVGFCSAHYDKMLSHRGRLSLALMLQTHLEEMNKNIFSGGFLNPAPKKAQKARRLSEECFICAKIDWGFQHMLETIYRCYETEKSFRELFDNQPMFCLPHYELLVSGIDKRQMKRYGSEMAKSLTDITSKQAKALMGDINNYCKVYNYQNSAEGCDWQNSKDSVERAIGFLTGRKLEK